MVLCAAAEYLRQQPAPQTIAGLNEHRTLGYLHNGQLQKWQLYDPQQGEVRFSPQTWLIQDDFAAIAAAVQQGMGIAWLPDWLVAQALADGTLQQVLAPSAQVRFAIHAVWPEGPWLPQKRGRRSMPCGKGCLLPQHLVSAERNNRHLWRRRFSDSVQATGALYAIASATRPSGTGGTAVQRAAGDTQYLRRPADVAVDPARYRQSTAHHGPAIPRAATAQAWRDTPPAARRASACRPHRREPALPSGRSAAGVRFPATAAG